MGVSREKIMFALAIMGGVSMLFVIACYLIILLTLFALVVTGIN